MSEHRKPTQAARILRHLRDYGSISSLDAIREYGIMRLASRISELKKEGEKIGVRMEKGVNRYGEDTHYAVYYLKEA